MHKDDVKEKSLQNVKEGSLYWGIEFGRLKNDELCLCVKYKYTTDKGEDVAYIVGSLVNVQAVNNSSVVFTVEHLLRKKWWRFSCLATDFSTDFNLEWIQTPGNTSVISMGFYPTYITAKDILSNGGQISASDIETGFLRVKLFIYQSPDIEKARTWVFNDLMLDAGFDAKKPGKLDLGLVIADEWDLVKVKAFVAKAKMEWEKLKSEEGVPKKRKPKVEQTEEKGEESGPSKKQKKGKGPKGADKEGQPGPLRLEANAGGTKRPDPKQKEKARAPPRSAVPDESGASSPTHGTAPQKIITEGKNMFDVIKQYFTFGMDKTFKVPVELISNPTADLVYRMFNQDHAIEIAQSMIKNRVQEPQICDLIPYRKSTSKMLVFKNTAHDLKEFKNGLAKKEINFLAISGQHSARAAQYIGRWAETNANLKDVWKRLEFRTARILSSETPKGVLAQHSEACNKANESSVFKSSFEDMLLHARKQWELMGKPEKPGLGTNKHSNSNQAWMVRKLAIKLHWL